MAEDLRKEAKKIVEAKKTFYTVCIVFGGTALVLAILMLAIPAIAFWLALAFPVFALVLGVLYLNAFGFPGTDKNAANWEEAEIEKEVRKLQRQRSVGEATERQLKDDEALDLKDLEPIEQPLANEEDFV